MGRRSRNKVVGLEDANGNWTTNGDDFLRIAVGYFADLFSRDDERVLGLVDQRVTATMNEQLLNPFNEEDFKIA